MTTIRTGLCLHQCTSIHSYLPAQAQCYLQSVEAENAQILHLNHFKQNTHYLSISFASSMSSSNFTKLLGIYFRENMAIN